MNKADFGDVIYRPVDKRENYVKRCIGMPGDTIEIRDNQVYIDGVAAKNPEKMQLNYFVETDGSMLGEEQFCLLDVSKAEAMPGVERIFTVERSPYHMDRLPETVRFPIDGECLWAGQPIAIVAAETPELAEDAVDAIVLEYEELPHITNL